MNEKDEIEKLKRENLELKNQLRDLEKCINTRNEHIKDDTHEKSNFEIKIHEYFNKKEIERYSRQLNLKSFGIEGN